MKNQEILQAYAFEAFLIGLSKEALFSFLLVKDEGVTGTILAP
jgi:hypothetical protein